MSLVSSLDDLTAPFAQQWLRERIDPLRERDSLYHFVISATKPIDGELRRFILLADANGKRRSRAATGE